MASFDTLLDKIADPALREALAEEFAIATNGKQFGLVFERHLPESVETPGVRPRAGDRVNRKIRDKTVKKQPTLRVVATKGADASVVTVADDGTVSEPETIAIDELVVVKEFKEPIYAGMKRLGSIDRGGDKPVHTVIRGENYHALEALLYTDAGNVDVIYIDPPYNTGSDSWIYNDRYVDSNDGYRHSKWLAFMERRLLHARRLLKDTGVVILAIDDNEHARLKLLCDEVFGETNFLMNSAWQGGTKNDSKFGGGGLDYMLMYAKSKVTLTDANVKWTEPKEGLNDLVAAGSKAWADSGGDHEAATKMLSAWWGKNKKDYEPGLGDNVKVDSDGTLVKVGDISWPGGGGPRYEVLHPVTGKPIVIPSGGWRYPDPETMQQKIAEGRVLFGKDETSSARRKTPLSELTTRTPQPSFYRDRRAASLHLKSVLGSKDFPYPKDVNVLSRWINIVAGSNSNAVILDFFAGTGTTAEAVMRLNAADGGRRRSIIVTNNELAAAEAKRLEKAGHKPGDAVWEAQGVYEKVTRRRIETVVTGMRRDGSKFSDGLDENVEFLELTYEDEKLVALGRRFRAVAPLLWMKAGSAGSIIETIDPSGYAAPSDANYAVLFETDQAKKLSAAITGRENVGTVFIVSDSDSAYQSAVRSLPNHGFGLTCVRLYSNYLRSFQINTQGV